MNHQILRIAVPAIIANITVPLLALTDTTIAGHMGAAACIGAVAVGGMLFNMAYWLFGFLRMGTGGLTAQAYGAGDRAEAFRVLLRSLSVAAFISLCLIVLQRPIVDLAFTFITATYEVREMACRYYYVLIWGAPAVLGLYSLTGWFLGMQNTHTPMLIAVLQNVVNIVVSCTLVFAFRMKIEGIAAGTLVAQYMGFGLSVWVCKRRYLSDLPRVVAREVFHRADLKKFFRVNSDIFLRTLCLILVTTGFTAFGSAQGELTLAANTLLMQFFVLFSYVMDGFAYVGEALGGRFVGAKDALAYKRLAVRLFLWGIVLSTIYSLLYIFLGDGLLSLLTNEAEVVKAAAEYLPFACAVPLISFSAFLFDGLFIGVTATRGMLLSMVAASALFFIVIFAEDWLQFGNYSRNNVLWTAFLLYLGIRGVVQALLFPRIIKKITN